MFEGNGWALKAPVTRIEPPLPSFNTISISPKTSRGVHPEIEIDPDSLKYRAEVLPPRSAYPNTVSKCVITPAPCSPTEYSPLSIISSVPEIGIKNPNPGPSARSGLTKWSLKIRDSIELSMLFRVFEIHGAVYLFAFTICRGFKIVLPGGQFRRHRNRVRSYIGNYQD